MLPSHILVSLTQKEKRNRNVYIVAGPRSSPRCLSIDGVICRCQVSTALAPSLAAMLTKYITLDNDMHRLPWLLCSISDPVTGLWPSQKLNHGEQGHVYAHCMHAGSIYVHIAAVLRLGVEPCAGVATASSCHPSGPKLPGP